MSEIPGPTMKPMVATNALIDTKVVRSAVVVAFEM